MQLSVNRYHISGENDYLSVDGVRAQGIPTTSARGTPPGDAPFNSVWSTGFTYEHNNLAGFKLSTLLFSQEYEALLGATNSQSFQDTTIAPNKTLYDQSRAVSSKLGAKLALTRDDLLEDTLKVTAGFDVLLDKNKQDLYLTKRTYVPEIEYTNYSEGFGMPDVGRALRDIDTEGVDLSRANNVKPVVTKNIEAGLRVQQGAVDFEASYFRSSAKLGDSVTLNSDDDFVSKREKTRVQGVEVRSGYKINE
ncbi:TonB-dependent receptor [Symbiopectobacterium sp. Eva_TO]